MLERLLDRHGWTVAVWAATIALGVFWALRSPNFSSFDVGTLAIAAVPLAFAAMAQAVVLISGGVDLSVGSLMSLVNVISAGAMLSHGFGFALAVSAAMLVLGILAGAFTGTLAAVLRVPDIVATLAMLFVWGGIALLVMPNPGGGAPQRFADLATGTVVSQWFPTGFVILLAALVVFWLPFRWRRPGLALYGVGGDRTAAFLSGVNVTAVRIGAYAAAGMFAALGGLALTATASSGNATGGSYYTLESVGAAVLGGVSLVGGRGGMIGPIAAAALLALVQNSLVVVGVDGNYAQIYEGVLIIAVVMIGGAMAKGRRR